MKNRLFPILIRGSLSGIVGFCLGLVACAASGYYVSSLNFHKDMCRIPPHMAPGTGCFVTIRQLIAYVRDHATPNQTLVVVGGSSVMYGSGQGIDDIWTLKLQELLGSGYFVINVAQPGGGPCGYATVLIEALSQEYPKHILVTDGWPPYPPDGMLWYKHLFWDSYYKRYLNKGYITRPENRMKDIANETEIERTENERIGMIFDSVLFFHDLWTYVHYSFGNMVYSPHLAGVMALPRRDLNDYKNLVPVPIETRFYQSGNPSLRPTINIVKRQCGRPYSDEKIKLMLSGISKDTMTDNAKKTVIVDVPYNEYYRNLLTIKQRSNYITRSRQRREIFQQAGYNVVDMWDLHPEDYGDMCHLIPLGGDKVAQKVYDIIKSVPQTNIK